MNAHAAVKMRRTLPRYNMALGPAEETLLVEPPFTFPGATARVFPLRANMNILSSFCRQYLNVAPEICEFRPYLPYVLLAVLDYGRMAVEKANLGWVSQHEVFFLVPLGMWRRDRRGRRTFSKWVMNTPYILVDNASSLTTGRETYGWPKVLAQLQFSPERWLIDPRNPTRFLTLDVMGPDSDRLTTPLIYIDQQTGQNASLVPPNLGLIDPFARFSRLVSDALAIGSDLAEILLAAPLSGFGPRYQEDRLEVLFDSLPSLFGFYGHPKLDVVTLKQFRDSEIPPLICYQALVESWLGVARYNSGGLLGLYNLLQGDLSGGFRISLFDNPAFPIVESLGLEVVKGWTDLGRTVSLLKPFFPFWMNVDLTYGTGKTICWRTRGKPWYREKIPVGRVPPKEEQLYNTVAGGAEQVWYGPYFIPEAGFDVYPLRANPERLKHFLEGYLNTGRQLRFQLDEVEGHVYVYMIASENRMFSRARSAAWMESRQIGFYVPLLLEPRHQRGACTPALATPFAFVDNPSLVVTLREVQGVPAMNASIEAPSRLARRKGPFLTMQADVFAAVGAGLPSQLRTLLEVVPGPQNPTPHVHCDLLDQVFPTRVLARLMLKQFPDAANPQQACYQSLVLEPWSILCDAPEPRTTAFRRERRVRIYRYPSLPVVQTLGLEVTKVLPPKEPEGAIADVLVAHHPFRIKLGLEIGLGKELSQTAGFLAWSDAPSPLETENPGTLDY